MRRGSQTKVSTAQQANKLLRFSKNNADTGLKFTQLGKLCMVALSDAAWGVRRNSGSQGGYFVLLMHSKVLQGHMDQPYIILDWRSFKLPRISRSSLNSEAQACSAAMDALEYLMIFWHGCMVHDFDLRYLTLKTLRCNQHVIDANVLFDSIEAEVPQLQGDKRTKIEIMIVKQKMDEIGTKLRWISSEIKLADGVTRLRARQLLADRIRTNLLSLQADRTFQAAKRKTQAERQASAHRNASGRMAHKGSLGYVVLTNQLVPVRGEDSSHDHFHHLHIFHHHLHFLHLAVLSTNDMVLEELFWLNQDMQFPRSCRAPRLRPNRTVRFQRCASTWKINVIELTC